MSDSSDTPPPEGLPDLGALLGGGGMPDLGGLMEQAQQMEQQQKQKAKARAKGKY